MRRSRRQRQRQARSRQILVIVVLVIVALVGGWLYVRSRHVEPTTATPGVAPAVTATITIPVPGSTPPASVAPAPTVQAAPVTSVPTASVESPEAREASWVASRKEAIRIQSELRAAQNAEKDKAKGSSSSDVRCVDGQRMKRVENGWVQDGKC